MIRWQGNKLVLREKKRDKHYKNIKHFDNEESYSLKPVRSTGGRFPEDNETLCFLVANL